MPRARKPTTETAPKRVRRSTKKLEPAPEVGLPAEEIAAEAYAQYLARNGQQGDALTDWLIAEQIVRRRHVTSSEAS
jgi:hypothetical protein